MPRIDLDDYELGEQIGAGTVGTIFRVTSKATGDVRAVKILSPAVSNSEIVVSRFKREMLVLEKLNHPNILGYFGGGEQDGQLFFVMELINGGTLKEMLTANGRLTWREAAECMRQMAAALQHAHNFGIIHRDFKPGNIFVTQDGSLKLGDFGIARDTREQDLTEAGLTVGTYSYMPPELIRGDEGVTGQVDLYAMGCVLFELLTGSPPYQGDNFVQIFDQHLTSQPPPLSEYGVTDCPPKLEQLVHHLMQKKPEDRPFNARWVQGFLGDLLDAPADIAEPTEDRAAGEVKLGARDLLAKRVEMRHGGSTREVQWSQLGWLVAVILAILLIAMMMNRG
ncbi:MAG: serine/threonine-protein kinase [Planctomycetota bacterium]